MGLKQATRRCHRLFFYTCVRKGRRGEICVGGERWHLFEVAGHHRG